jgi:hypothetical protein
MASARIAGSIAIGLAAAFVISNSTFSADEPEAKAKRTIVKSVQPDYSKWESLKVGMTETDVEKLLGDPIEKNSSGLIYGRLEFDSPSVPQSFEFSIRIRDGKVLHWGHPFGGKLSPDGKPTKPMLIYPRDRSKFDHYPRFVDLRWSPSSGKYPIEYAIEIQSGQYELRGGEEKPVLVYHDADDLVSELPYAAFSFVGKNPGRWRVKAKNELGESEWSEWRLFVFEQ